MQEKPIHYGTEPVTGRQHRPFCAQWSADKHHRERKAFHRHSRGHQSCDLHRGEGQGRTYLHGHRGPRESRREVRQHPLHQARTEQEEAR